MEYSDYVIYVDESGDHGLNSIDPSYPIFVLDFCIFRKKDFARNVVPMMQDFKFRHFGHDIVVLHERSIRKQKPPFIFLRNEDKREEFMQGLNKNVQEAEFTIIASVIHKQKHKDKYVKPDNPYELALQFCMERAHRFLSKREQEGRTTYVVVERRGRDEDNQLELEFRRICDGTGRYRQKMPEFEIIFADKKTNSTGLQLADLTARPIGLHSLDSTQPNRAWNIIESKLDKSPSGKYQGFGLKEFP